MIIPLQVIEKKGSKLVVDLRRPEDDEPTQDDDRPVSVRDALVFLEVARFSSPASKPEGTIIIKATGGQCTRSSASFCSIEQLGVFDPSWMGC